MLVNPFAAALLQPAASRARRLRLWWRLAACWAVAGCLSSGVVALEGHSGWSSALALPAIAVAAVAVAILLLLRGARAQTDWRRLAAQIEGKFPDLDGRLLTALQQQPREGNALNYLQERLLGETLLHSRRNDWAEAVPGTRVGLAQAAHWLALALFAVALFGWRDTGGHTLLSRAWGSGIAVTPGDTSIEKGNTLVVLARFAGALPPTVDLVVGRAPEPVQRIPLVKSLADPMFGGSVPEVASNLVYHVEYAGERSRSFRVAVFEHPRLERADATLDFPAYTRLPPQHIENTRRLSAVEGSRLDLALRLNKPVVSARLVARSSAEPKSEIRTEPEAQGNAITLEIESGRASASVKQFPLDKSRTYELQLVDADGRTNKVQSQFVFEVLTNRTPEVRLTWPRGDQRPSPLEEIAFEGSVWDDFGVEAYGLGYALVGQETKFVELGRGVPGKEKRLFQHLLRLEELGVKPDQLVSWFVWADDLGPDGQVRRTTSDLFFGEVRPFEEVFREGQGMDGQGASSAQQQGRTGKLAEEQKQIINATWRLQREHGPAKPQTRIPNSESRSESRLRWTTPLRGAAREQAGNLLAMAARFTFPGRCGSQTRGPGPRLCEAQRVGGLTPSNHADAQGFLWPLRVADPRSWIAPLRGAASGFGQVDVQDTTPGRRASDSSAKDAGHSPRSGSTVHSYDEDATVVRDAQAQALEQAQAAASRQHDPGAAALWSAVVQQMEEALVRLSAASNSPASLPQALAAEQAAYQAFLKLQEHEYQVMRSRNRSRGGSSRNQQMELQLEQMDLAQSENRYETQRQAQSPANPERHEQLQVMSRLQDLARRQQDLNDRLKELQTAMQEARTEQERAEIQRRLKRLEEEEQQMLGDVDELRQRMDRPENQSRMAEERQQLDQTRNEVERAAQAASQGAASQALAAGTRAQRQLQQLRDQMRQENSSQFADDLRGMRNEARELARQQEDLTKRLEPQTGEGPKPLSDSGERQAMLDQLAHQKERLTNLVEQATHVSEQAESAEPLLSHELYDTVRKFTQDSAKAVQETQDQLIERGLMRQSLYDELKVSSEPDGAKMADLTAEMLRRDFVPQANETAQRARAGIDELKRGVERAAESVLGDDTEALRLAQQELKQLTEQLQQEAAQAGAVSAQSNQTRLPAGGQDEARQGTNNLQTNGLLALRAERRNPAGRGPGNLASTNEAQLGEASQRGNARSGAALPGEGRTAQDGEAQSAQAGQESESPANRGERGGAARSDSLSAAADGGTENGGYNNNLGGNWNQFFNSSDRWLSGPITGANFVPWSDRLRDVEEMIEQPEWRNFVAAARERARVLRQAYKHDGAKPDWAVVRLQVMQPLIEVRERIADELAHRQSAEALVPIDRDPVPNRYSDLVRKYYEELGKDK